MTKGVLKLPKESGSSKEGLAERIVNKPSRSRTGSCSKGEAENWELANIEHRCWDRYGAVCMWQTLSHLK